MTAVIDRPAPHPAAPAARRSASGVTFPRVVVSEWIKFRTLRSTVWTLAVTVILMVGISVLVAWGMSSAPPGSEGEGPPIFGGPALITVGYGMAQLTVAVLGVLAVTGEYTTGMIRSTMAAVPRRVPALVAKALVVSVVVTVVSLVGVALSYVATIGFHDTVGISFDLGDSTTQRILLGTPLYLATVGLLAFAIGALLRHSAGAIAAVLGLLLVIETVFSIIPLTFFEKVSPFLPSTAGGRLLQDDATLAITDAMSDGVHLTPWQGYGVMLGWVAVLLTAAIVLLRRRDA